MASSAIIATHAHMLPQTQALRSGFCLAALAAKLNPGRQGEGAPNWQN